jgi:hypothetical protein
MAQIIDDGRGEITSTRSASGRRRPARQTPANQAIEHAAVAFDHPAPVLVPRSRLIADITSPPKKPIVLMTSAISAACHGQRRDQNSAAPSVVALATPL